MAYEVLLDEFLDELSKSGIDVSKIHITEPEYVNEYVELSETEKRKLYVKPIKSSESFFQEYTAFYFLRNI